MPVPAQPDLEVGRLLPPPLLDTWCTAAAAVWPDQPEVPALLRACLDRTLRRSLHPVHDGVAVVTGDIPAMWLRDSSTQMWPYLRLVDGLAPGAPLARLLLAVVRRQLHLMAHDPYANAFNVHPDGAAHARGDLWGDAPADPLVWERKYEIDSLCFPVRSAARWRAVVAPDGGCDALLLDGTFMAAARAMVRTLTTEQHHEARSPYRFVRPGGNALDTLPRDGLGTPVAPTGMTWSGFRPSDDACTFGYNVPANLHAAAALGDLATLLDAAGARGGADVDADEAGSLAARARALGAELREGVRGHGTVVHPRYGRIWAYEVDGRGGALLMDDANMPSLLSLPLVADVDPADPLYRATREFVLSGENPQFSRGAALTGVGSPHTWPGWVWPIALAVEGLTTGDLQRRRELAVTVATTTGGTGHVHESVHPDDPARYTREWFSWADSMFCELVMDTVVLALGVPGRPSGDGPR